MSRENCAECTRPISECYCSAIVDIVTPIKVIIIQHPKEVQHPYNTGRIAHRCLKNSELIIAEQLDNETLGQLTQKDSVLLFPEMTWLAPSQAHTETTKQLIVIDATWKKAKKILHLNPALQSLPRMSFTRQNESEYEIRKTSIADGLATIESIAEALQQLAPETPTKALLKPFHKMVSLAQRYTPD